MPYRFTDCTVVKIIDESDVVKRFFFEVPDEQKFSFRAGQFVLLDLPIDSKVTTRGYSIASAPSEDNIFELTVVLKPGGLGTTYLFNEVSIGSTVKVSQVLGKFGLPQVIETDLCFICTGTGIAPLRSMTLDIFNKNIPHKNIYMIFGNRWVKDILYRKEMEAFAAEHPEFKFIPVLSRTNEEWNGRSGYVHPVYEELFADKRPAYFYVCGWPAMIKEARQRIEAMGYERKFIKFEQYD
jgi:CDP-4-dehydro-6-deoxyglucose reductase